MRSRSPRAAACLVALLSLPLTSALAGCAGRVQGADSPAELALNAGRAAEYAGVAAQVRRDPRGAVPSVNRVIRSDEGNGLGYYLRASIAARQEAWRSAHYLIRQGNQQKHLLVYVDPQTRKPDAATLALLRTLAEDCAKAAPFLEGADVDGEALLYESALLAKRLGEQAEPRAPEVREAAALARIAVEDGRALLFEKQGRFADAEGAYKRKREGERALAAVRRGRDGRSQVAAR